MAVTPMMQQYLDIKANYRDYLLFYRLGDFYELFYEDAKTGANELDLVLTGKDCGEEERAPMCGMPHHSIENYINRLVEKGYKVAVCEQLEDPAEAKGIVKRDVVRVVTPGTVIESDFLNESQSNYLCGICIENNESGVAFIDITTGIINTTFFTGSEHLEKLYNELGVFSPSEVIMNLDKSKFPKITKLLTEKLNTLINDNQPERFELETAKNNIETKFKGRFQVEYMSKILVRAAGAVLSYLYDTQKSDLLNVTELDVYDKSLYMEIDVNTRRNLELTETMRNREKKGSLLSVIDKTKTSRGAKTLKQWIERPLLNCTVIQERHQAVSELIEKNIEKSKIIQSLSRIYDTDKIVAKIVYRIAHVRDLKKISAGIESIPAIKEQLALFGSGLLRKLDKEIDSLKDIRELIDEAIDDDIPANTKDGGYIKKGYSKEIDNVRSIVSDNKTLIENIERDERESTGIRTLKVGYNKIFGYYIEVTKSNVSQVPERYIRKQTLTNAERYVTQELKEMEEAILEARDKAGKLEEEIFENIKENISNNIGRFQRTNRALADVDALCSLAETAEKYSYVCPEVDYSTVLKIKEGRHPVVEQLTDDYYVPNDVDLDTDKSRLYIITGPNMAGKSTYMRQTAIITLLAQIGSFVPAKEARIGIVDKIFTRVGASDDLAAGQSTFMTEMSEVAYILNNATKKSLIIYDEIGRGTSTFDGMSIARATLEYTANKKLGAKTLFATHYHELTELENETEGVLNYNIAAKKRDDDIIFLRKIVRGAADDSYGIEVAKLAGVPNEVVRRAKEILASLEEKEQSRTSAKRRRKIEKEILESQNETISFEDIKKQEIFDKIRTIDINVLSPLEAFNVLYELKKLSDR